DKPTIIAAFFTYAQERQKAEAAELIAEENLNEEAAKRYIQLSLKREYASENGTDLNSILPKMSPINPQYRTKKQNVLRKIAAFVEKYKGVGGEL
ncbi:type I restriction endonuclease subunit R, EcoR124 family, partial [Capnocytophaga gingivalis]